jgi:[ribosomal protein S5]-alanine N-acetyltransferase
VSGHDELTIETPRLRLRTMRADDVTSLLRVFTDPNVMASFGGALFDQEQMRQWVGRNLEHQNEYGYGLFAIILKASGELIGDCGLEHMLIAGNPVVELGYDLRSEHWGQRLATEAAAAVRDYAFQTLGLPGLVSLIRLSNIASIRVAERIGMRPEAEITRFGHVYWIYAINRLQRG